MGVFVLHDGKPERTRYISNFGVCHGTAIDDAISTDTVIVWSGSCSEALGKSFRRVLNAPSITKRLHDQPTLRKVLSVYGVGYESIVRGTVKSPLWMTQPAQERYAVSVFDMNALAIWLLTDGKRERAEETATVKRIMRLAVRAVYAAGIDIADVTVRSGRSGTFVIERIDPVPRLDDVTAPLYKKALAELERGCARAPVDAAAVILGMDPEFILINPRGKIVPASRYLDYKGNAGYDSATVRGLRGVHPLAELRPEPSGDPAGLIRNLRRTMWIAAAQIDDPSLRWIAGGMPIPGLPLGGHIHISGIRLSGPLVRALDNYLALPLLMLEHPQAKARRKKYGRLGDVREKSYGGFEYRTLPSLLMSPTVTKGTVALTKLIATNCERLTRRPLGGPEILLAYYEGDKDTLAGTVDSLWKELECLPDFELYRKYLIPLGRWIAQRRTWDERSDFRGAWRIPPFH